MFNTLQNIITITSSFCLVIMSIAYNSKVNQIKDLELQLNTMQVKEFNISNQLAQEASKNYELTKSKSDKEYEKTYQTISTNNKSNNPCIDSNSLQELNNYISSTSTTKP